MCSESDFQIIYSKHATFTKANKTWSNSLTLSEYMLPKTQIMDETG